MGKEKDITKQIEDQFKNDTHLQILFVNGVWGS